MTGTADQANALQRLRRYAEALPSPQDALLFGGKIVALSASHFRVAGLGRHAAMRDVLISHDDLSQPLAEIVQLDAGDAVAVPYDATASFRIGQALYRGRPLEIAPDEGWLGRVVNAFGRPIDNGRPLEPGAPSLPIRRLPPNALERRPIERGVETGIGVIDLFTPLCVGQRLGIFAGSGVGKSTLTGMLANSGKFDVTVVAMIGERGREVKEFIDSRLALSTSNVVAVAATSDDSALMRRMAAWTAMTVAESFRDKGKSVLLILDSITRFAHACREIAIAANEPPVSRGFPPSVFSELPRLLERAGPGPMGSGDITGIFAVLVDGDDHNDPIADAVRGILDGHIVLDRAIAGQGRYPAVDIVGSISRLTHIALSPERQAFSNKLRRLIGRFEEARDLRAMGGYQPGLDTELDTAVAIVPLVYSQLNQAAVSNDPFDIFHQIVDVLKQHGATPG